MKLTGSNNNKLNKIICYNNLLTSLNLSQFDRLETLICANNLLSKLTLKLPNSERLSVLNISFNIFQPQSLEFLRSFVNLKSLSLRGNPFYGNLGALNKIKNLDFLDASDTYLNVEHTLKNIEVVCYSPNKVKIFLKVHQNKNNVKRKLEEVVDQLERENEKLRVRLVTNEKQRKAQQSEALVKSQQETWY